MAKAKRYDEGGVTEGKNAGIDDDTRARAMKYVQEQSEKGSEDESSGEKTVSRTTASKVSTKPASVKAEAKTEAKADARDAEAGRSRGRPAEGAPKGTMGANPPRARTKEEVKDAIPTGGKKGAGPTESKGNSASGSEVMRNLQAMGPGRLAGLGNAAAEGAMAMRAAKAAKTAQAAREAKTLNPAAWMAGPKGMKENFKSGGGVKGWGIARGSRAAKTY
jgi:hypothetical protein